MSRYWRKLLWRMFNTVWFIAGLHLCIENPHVWWKFGIGIGFILGALNELMEPRKGSLPIEDNDTNKVPSGSQE